MLGVIQALSALATQRRQEKDFNPSRALFPSGALPSVVGEGWTIAVLLTGGQVELGCGESWTTRLSCCTPKTLPGSLLCVGKAACLQAMQLFLPQLSHSRAGESQERAAIRACSRGLGWLRHPLLGVTAPHPREAF